MSPRGLLQRILAILLPLSVASTLYLYLYPIVQQCAFPVPSTKNNNNSARGGDSFSAFAAKNGVINTLFQHVVAAENQNTIRPEPAIFRLLVLADPQIEGDSALPKPEDEFGARLRRHWEKIQSVLFDTAGGSKSESESDTAFVTAVLADIVRTTIYEDVPSAIRAALKRVDLVGNDYYLAHIYRTLSWWSRPTHVTVLGDLIGSQWVTDQEFEKRAGRYWQRLFRGGEKVSDDLTITGKKKSLEGEDGGDVPPEEAGIEPLSRFNSSWTRRIINVAGNHDIGYAGDVSRHRLDRFERVFGRANWDIRFQHPPLEAEKQEAEKNIEDENAENSGIQPTLHIINLNDLTLDGPAFENEIQIDGYGYINDLISHRSYPVEDETSFTLLLTHVPLHKRAGICVDGPHFSYFDNDDNNDDDDGPRFKQGGLREQNHLSDHASGPGILQGIFGMSGDADTSAAGGRGRRGLILTGHDHEGCDVVHFVNRTSTDNNENEQEPENSQPWHWDAIRYSPSALRTSNNNGNNPAIREVTLRSMMGMYGGNAALLSLWFDADPDVNSWQYELQTCSVGGQQIWWTIHGLALACLGGVLLVLLLWVVESVFPAKTEKTEKKVVQQSSDRRVEKG